VNSQVTLLAFGQLFDALLNQYVVNALGVLIAWLVPIAVTLVTIWVLLYGYATVRNETGDSIATFAGKALKIAVILAVALTSNLYMSWVVGGAYDLMNSLAGMFLQAGGLPATTVTSVWTLIDQYDAQVETVVVTLGRDALQVAPPFVNFPNLFAIVLISLGGCFFEVCLLAVACFAKIVLTLALALGPMFILALMFAATSRFFDAWLSKLLSAVMLSSITFFLAGLSLAITTQFLTNFLAESSTVNFVVAGMVIGVIECLLAIVMIQAPTLAAALTGGAVYRSGLGTVSALLAARGWRAGARVPPVAAGRGATNRYAAGGYWSPQSFGRGAAAASGVLRRAAYKLASLRSRT